MTHEKIFLIINVLTYIPAMIVLILMFSLRRKYYNQKHNVDTGNFLDLSMNLKQSLLNFRIILLFPFFLPVKLIDDTDELIIIRKKIKKINIWFIIVFVIIIAESLYGKHFWPSGFTL